MCSPPTDAELARHAKQTKAVAAATKGMKCVRFTAIRMAAGYPIAPPTMKWMFPEYRFSNDDLKWVDEQQITKLRQWNMIIPVETDRLISYPNNYNDENLRLEAANLLSTGFDSFDAKTVAQIAAVFPTAAVAKTFTDGMLADLVALKAIRVALDAK